ncbi:MAG: carbamoyltransferase HypF, partial [Woeseiaceae bacterium]
GETSYEAQGPMLLESMCRRAGESVALPIAVDDRGIARSDWQPLFERLAGSSAPPAELAELFHTSMAGVVLAQARFVREQKNIDCVGLTGGVFQNRVLAEQTLALLKSDGFDVRLSTTLPCNDAALCFGQAAEVAALASGQPAGGA